MAHRLTSLTICNDTLHTQILRRLNGTLGKVFPLLYAFIQRMGYMSLSVSINLGLLSYLCHRLHSLNRILSAGSLTREHQRIGTHIDSIGDIGNLRTRGSWVVYHGVKHLCCHDNRFLCTYTFIYNVTLNTWYALQRHLYTEVATRNHDTV